MFGSVYGTNFDPFHRGTWPSANPAPVSWPMSDTPNDDGLPVICAQVTGLQSLRETLLTDYRSAGSDPMLKPR